MRALIAAACAGVLGFAAAPAAQAAAHAPAPGALQEADLGVTQVIDLFGIAPGSDGDMWLPDMGCMGMGPCGILRITPRGGITGYKRGLNPGSLPYAIAQGPDGNMWFTDAGTTPAIGRITPRGRITEYSVGLNQGSAPFEIVAGAHGDLWFTDAGTTPAIGRITTSGRITEYSVGLPPGSAPFGIAAARGGDMWFTDRACVIGASGASGSPLGECAIGRITPRGRITEYRRGLRAGADPLGIATGPGGRIWFADSSGAIGRISSGGRISEFTKGLNPGSSPVAIAAAPDGDMWFTDDHSNAPAVGRVTSRGAIIEFTAGLNVGSLPALLAPGPDGREWFTDEAHQVALGRAITGAANPSRERPTLVGAARSGSTLACRPPGFPSWAGSKPSLRRFKFDGYTWLRDGKPIVGQHRGTIRLDAADAGQRIACRVTATYPIPLLVTEVDTSRTVKVSP